MNTNIPTITVDPELRELILPSEKLVLGINGDVEVNAVQFQLPLTYRELELKKLTPRINYVNPNGDVNYYESTMESDESNCYFIWPITPDITAYTGHVRFSLTLYQTEEGTILHKFNTRSATGRVYTGFEAEKQVTPEQQLTLLSKLETQIKADLNDHTERLKDQLTKKGKEILDGFGESGSASEELKAIKQDLNTKLTAPPTPEAGKILKIKSVNEDGTFTCEWADDGGSNLDVRIDGKSIVQDGVAEIPVANGVKYGSSYGLVHFVAGYCYGIETGRIKIPNYEATDGIKLVIPSTAGMNGRYNPGTNGFGAITTNTFDDAVKAAMCDGKGAAWTAEEQAAARERMGIDEWEDVLDMTLEEDSLFSADFEHEYKQLYIYIDQSGVMEKICTTIYLYPYSYVNGDGKKVNTFGSYFPPTSKAYSNVASVWKSYGKVTTRIASVTNDQKNTTGNQTTCLKVWDTSMLNINGIGDPFKGIYPSGTIFKAGTRIVVKGVRA